MESTQIANVTAAYSTRSAVFFYCHNDAERYCQREGFDRLAVRIEFISKKYDNVDNRFRTECGNRNGLFRFSFVDGSSIGENLEKIAVLRRGREVSELRSRYSELAGSTDPDENAEADAIEREIERIEGVR